MSLPQVRNAVRAACWHHQAHPFIARDLPRLTVLLYVFATGEVKQLKFHYYISKKGRFCFRWGPGLFDGMKETRFAQFEYDHHGGVACMVTLGDRRTREHFDSCVLRAVRRRHKAEMKKFVGGDYKRNLLTELEKKNG